MAESGTARGRVEDTLAAFAGWHPQVRRIIGTATRPCGIGWLYGHDARASEG